ncbi:DUF4376 domain-containing protein [Chromohalobacter nigrandesensis]|uniref:DUF4376 domain-containing protein n=1 Tax=Chromohalobacter nigrandesensis TaxID=119863 RepID=UPI001FF30FB8|nr:DUF4376 domain-containing protein [Chromohalobacter nigrandesensis]MCK0743561.1 DUF4376 domain-containing protein [Chromohalobacter nigrandesensis]
MQHFKTPVGRIYAYGDSEEVDTDAKTINGVHYANMPDDLTPIDGDEARKIANPPPSLDTLAKRKRRAIDAARDQAFATGLDYDVAGEPDVVQTRAQDQINLLGLRAKAESNKAAGVTDAVMEFRGKSNKTRMLNPEEMIALTTAALDYIEGVYKRSWERKDAVAAALEDEDREGIEAVEW